MLFVAVGGANLGATVSAVYGVGECNFCSAKSESHFLEVAFFFRGDFEW